MKLSELLERLRQEAEYGKERNELDADIDEDAKKTVDELDELITEADWWIENL